MREERLTARGAARRALLLDTAIELVADAGAGALTHRAVATRAQVSLASVSYHFSSIDDLRTAMFEHAQQIVASQVAQAGVQSESAPESFAQFAADLVVALLTEHRAATIAMQEMVTAAAHDSALRPTFHRFHEELGELLASCIGDRDTGLTAASTIQGLLQTALTYPELDMERCHRSTADFISRLRTDRQTADDCR